MHDFRLPPLCKWDTSSSGMLPSLYWKLVTDVSGQPIGPILNGQARINRRFETTDSPIFKFPSVSECSVLEDGSDSCLETSVIRYPSTRCNIQEKRRYAVRYLSRVLSSWLRMAAISIYYSFWMLRIRIHGTVPSFRNTTPFLAIRRRDNFPCSRFMVSTSGL